MADDDASAPCLVPDVLDAAGLERVATLLAQAPWQPGAASAGYAARPLKHLRQVEASHPAARIALALAREAVLAHPTIRLLAMPARAGPMLASAAGPGEGYGAHRDEALMGGIRADLSFTLFLGGDFDGGTLRIRLAGEWREFRGPTGSLLLYPAGLLHEVTPVTAGERRVIAGWLESAVADAQARAHIAGLARAAAEIYTAQGPCPAHDAIEAARHWLIRRHA